MKSIVILGSTGSIGTQTLDVCRMHGFGVKALSASTNTALLEKQAREFKPEYVCIYSESAYPDMKQRLADTEIKVLCGMEGLCELARLDCDIVVNSVVGMVGLLPTLEAAKAGNDIALANKETLVAGGNLVTDCVKEHGVKLLPIDSEHSAIFQCLMGAGENRPEKILLTASGGPFYGKNTEELRGVTVEQALKHPNWSMGAKITIDSASMMNKGLEIIEAHHLYGLPLERIGVLVHPQSLVHSLVEFEDGSLMAQAGTPDMRMPIAYCLAWPLCLDAGVPPLDLARSGALTFEEPDLHSFPCLELACRTIGKGSALPVALNAANEVAVEAFLSGRIGFMDIPDIIGRALDECSAPDPASLEAIETLDHETRLRVGLWIEKV